MDSKMFFLVSCLALVHNSEDTTCPSRKFRCPNGNCFLKDYICDGDDECKDNSDESYCDGLCPKKEFRCRNGRLIDQRWICDGDNDCRDHSDELNCNTTCPHPNFRCKNGNCIPKSWLCDGIDNCKDYSDEQNCGITCSMVQFRCTAKGDIPIRWVCDGHYDCGDDDVDERDCGEYTSSIHATHAALLTPPEDPKSSFLTTEDTDQSTLIIEASEAFNSKVPYCITDYCQNGGKCEIVDMIGICRCPVGYEGEICQIKAEHLKNKDSESAIIIISISVLALAFAILSITMCLYPKKMASIRTTAREFVISFHQPRESGSNKKLTNSEEDII